MNQTTDSVSAAFSGLDPNEQVMNRAEAASFLDVNARTLDEWHEKGEGPPVCILCGSRRYLKSSLIAWVRSKETTSATARRIRPGNRRKQQGVTSQQEVS